ncbi:hypothetical protein COUCH_24880 [Couchioplanes caeruleus]|uniref:hypothetical protein n=1 Tax=Couchioplanes caeruleus TaxID=56438 RepID=UPI0020BDDD7D|nr:hypothetical protein [Couchioplanes caeruleus]UQU62261.1 hypothetical protein COUCH_24880 [Couchioplanes caeruleus]
MREPDERDLRVLLREEAERHRPDRDAMFERIVRGRAESRRTTLVRLRPLAAAAAVGLVVVGVVGVRFAGGGEGDSAPAAAPAPSAVRATPSPSPSATATSAPPKVSVSSKAAHRPGFLTTDGEVDAHSNPNWTQGNVTLRTTRRLTALAVTVSVSRTDGVATTGQWSTLPNEMVTMSVAESDGRLVYRFVLKDGASVSPGQYVFAVQFNHASKRSPAADTYAVSATGGGRDAAARGGF